MLNYLKSLDACIEAVVWASQYNSLQEAWSVCERGDWMLWLLQKRKIDKRTLTLCKARCAKLVIHLMKDQRSVDAVLVAERYGLGQATDEELREASAAAYDAYAAAHAAHATHAAFAAAYAAYVAAYAAAYAAAAAHAAHAATYAATYADVHYKTLKDCADEIRKIIKEIL